MDNPSVSIIMPVYNMDRFLNESIDSILDQSFKDFEFIIINDGSTDQSESIIKSYADSRIRYLSNKKNMGLVYTLNKGIDQAKGQWIARMDGDDISDSERLKKQMDFILKHPDTDLLSTRITLIDENGLMQGDWQDDIKAIKEKEIRSYLPYNNCIAHPTVLVRKSILQKFKYKYNQSESEDYDLWLRMIADGIIIRKLNEVLLKHRILSDSFTRKRQNNVYMKLFRIKSRFFIDQFKSGKINSFVIKTGIIGLFDFTKAILKFLIRG